MGLKKRSAAQGRLWKRREIDRRGKKPRRPAARPSRSFREARRGPPRRGRLQLREVDFLRAGAFRLLVGDAEVAVDAGHAFALGLRVVDVAGQPPPALRALARAALGAIGVAAAFLGLLPVLFDPAKRALHDRLLGTRVVKG